MLCFETSHGKQDLEGVKKELVSGLTVTTLAAASFGGEHTRNGPAYRLCHSLVSHWALITNFVQAAAIKLRQPKKPLKRILWDLGRNPAHVSSIFYDRFSRFNHQTKHYAAGWRALDLFYNYHEKVEPQLCPGMEKFVTQLWLKKSASRQAVRNRLAIVTNLLEQSFNSLAGEEEIRIVSLASGSAQAVVEAMKRCSNLNIKAVLIEPDKSALAEALAFTEQAGLADRFAFVRGTTRKLAEVCSRHRPHIIEMVGLMDYLQQKTAVELISRIRGCLCEGGIFVTCNIRSNREKMFLDWVLLWPMIYRSKREFTELFPAAGFAAENIRIVYEPFEIHGIAVCKK